MSIPGGHRLGLQHGRRKFWLTWTSLALDLLGGAGRLDEKLFIEYLVSVGQAGVLPQDLACHPSFRSFSFLC